jgi:hypothetical protein
MTSQHFSNIPIDIYHIIHSFLSHYDYRQLVNSSKTDFEAIKKETVSYDIAYVFNLQSFKFVPLRENKSKFDLEEAIVSAKKAVKNSENQVFVRIHTRIELPSNFNEITTGLGRLSVVYENKRYPAVRSDLLCSFSNVTDLCVELPRAITSLDFLQCYKLTSFHVKSKDLTDISKLRQFHELHTVYLRECASVRHVSSLRNIKKVSIYGSLGTSDLSELGNHEEFYLLSFLGTMSRLFKLPSKTNKLSLQYDLSQVNLNDYFDRDFDCNSCSVVNSGEFSMKFPPNLGINNLYLRRFQITKDRFKPTSLTSPLRELRLEGIVSENLDISNFCNLQSCCICDSASLKSITVNNHNRSVIDIINSEMLEEVTEVGYLDCFEIINCESLISVSGIVSVNKVVMVEENREEDFGPLKFTSLVEFSFLKKIANTGSVQLLGYPGFNDGYLISHVRKIEISNCKNFQDPSMLGAVNELTIIQCPINSLEGLQNVPILTIKNCPLNDLEGLGSNNKKVLINGASVELVISFHHGKYSHLKRLISDITVSTYDVWVYRL